MTLESLRLLTAPDAITTAQQAAAAELEPCYERMKAVLGLDFVNDFWDKQAQANELELEKSFSRGFRLGGQLALELCREDGPVWAPPLRISGPFPGRKRAPGRRGRRPLRHGLSPGIRSPFIPSPP